MRINTGPAFIRDIVGTLVSMGCVYTGLPRPLPSMCPLFFDFPDDPQAAEVEDGYLFGPDLLSALITRFGVRSREVYLPAGTDLTNVWTGKKFIGGTQVVVDAPIEHISIFARSGKKALLQGVIIA